jgi:cell division septation protein DedD
MSTRKIVLAHPWQGHAVGETVELDEDRARQIVQAAAATYADDKPVDSGPVEVTPAPVAPVSAALSAPTAPSASVRGDSATTPATGTVSAP